MSARRRRSSGHSCSQSIGFNGVGASRAGNEALLANLGIADQVKPKIKLLNEAAPAAVAKGEVEIGLGPMSEVLLVPGVQLAGPLSGRLAVLPGFHGVRVERQQQCRRGEIADQILDRACRCACLQSQRHGAGMIKAAIPSGQKPRR
jgi:hypothetical protein